MRLIAGISFILNEVPMLVMQLNFFLWRGGLITRTLITGGILPGKNIRTRTIYFLRGVS
jgi:hypothetical protein